MRRISLIVVLLATTILTARAQEVKSIIYLIGDGMGLSSVSMMQVEGGYEPTIFDRAENIALQKSYSMDNRVTDSAASGTALSSGCKTNNTYLGVTAEGAVLENLMEVAHGEGKFGFPAQEAQGLGFNNEAGKLIALSYDNNG